MPKIIYICENKQHSEIPNQIVVGSDLSVLDEHSQKSVGAIKSIHNDAKISYINLIYSQEGAFAMGTVRNFYLSLLDASLIATNGDVILVNQSFEDGESQLPIIFDKFIFDWINDELAKRQITVVVSAGNSLVDLDKKAEIPKLSFASGTKAIVAGGFEKVNGNPRHTSNKGIKIVDCYFTGNRNFGKSSAAAAKVAAAIIKMQDYSKTKRGKFMNPDEIKSVLKNNKLIEPTFNSIKTKIDRLP